jgi:hypothetical protein
MDQLYRGQTDVFSFASKSSAYLPTKPKAPAARANS